MEQRGRVGFELLELGRQAELVKEGDERLGSSCSTLTMVFVSQGPSAISMAAATGGTPGVADPLRLHVGICLGVIGHLIDERLRGLPSWCP